MTDQTLEEMIDGLGLEEPDVTDVTSYTEVQISSRFNKITQQLLDLPGEAIEPRSERGRELHSERSALIHEMVKRGMR